MAVVVQAVVQVVVQVVALEPQRGQRKEASRSIIDELKTCYYEGFSSSCLLLLFPHLVHKSRIPRCLSLLPDQRERSTMSPPRLILQHNNGGSTGLLTHHNAATAPVGGIVQCRLVRHTRSQQLGRYM